MTRSFAWDRFAFGFGPRGFFWAGPRGRRRRWLVGGHEVRHSETAQGQAPPWLRGDERAGRAAAWLLFAVPGHGVSHTAVARRRGTRGRERRGGQEGIRDHGRGAPVSGRAPLRGGRQFRSGARRGRPHARWRDGGREPLPGPAPEGRVPHGVAGTRRGHAAAPGDDPRPRAERGGSAGARQVLARRLMD